MTVAKVVDPAATAAILDYRAYRISMERTVAQLEASRRPLAARQVRHRIRIVVRALLAEQFNPEPPGIGELK